MIRRILDWYDRRWPREATFQAVVLDVLLVRRCYLDEPTTALVLLCWLNRTYGYRLSRRSFDRRMARLVRSGAVQCWWGGPLGVTERIYMLPDRERVETQR